MTAECCVPSALAIEHDSLLRLQEVRGGLRSSIRLEIHILMQAALLEDQAFLRFERESLEALLIRLAATAKFALVDQDF